ncbi:MAG: hypothetical protein QM831_10525 [Kofleriaceae bacterium]
MKFWVLLVLAACGDDGGNHHQIADAALTDAPIDAPPDAATNVTVRALDPIPDITVYFMNPDGSLAATVKTDATGTATAPFTGGSVTTVESFIESDFAFGQNYDVHTWLGAKPGDTLLLKQVSRPTNPPANQVMTLHVPTGMATDTNYIIGTTCGEYAPTDPTPGVQEYDSVFNSSCTDATKMDVTIQGFKGHVPTVVDTMTLLNVPIPSNGQVDLTAGTFRTASREVDVTNLGTSTAQFGVLESLFGPSSTSLSTIFFTDNGTTNATVTYPTAFAVAGSRSDITVIRQETMGVRDVIMWGVPAGTFSLDWSANTTPEFTSKPALDLAAQSWSWTASNGGVPEQAYVIAVAGTRLNYAFQWSVYGAANGTSSLAFPTLPTDVADFTLTGDDTLQVAELLAHSLGWDAIRQGIGVTDDLEPPIAVSATGKLAYTYYQDPPMTLQRRKHAVINR